MDMARPARAGLRYGGRILVRSPGFTLMAVLMLAIGIGVNVAAFSLFDMVALKAATCSRSWLTRPPRAPSPHDSTERDAVSVGSSSISSKCADPLRHDGRARRASHADR